MNKETIVAKIKSGDVQALKIVYELFYRPVFQAAYFITQDTGLAEDTVHDVFLKLKYKIEQLKDPSKLEAWLCRMAANNARDIIRRRSKNILCLEIRGVHSDSQLSSPETLFLLEADKEMIKQKINSLQPEFRQILYLKYYKEMSYEEICTALGLPMGTVKSRLFHAKQKFKKVLESEIDIPQQNTVKVNPEEAK